MSDKESTYLTIGQMAERMAEPGIPATYIAGQLRGYAQADLIHNFGKVHGSGRTAHRLYTEPMMAQAKLLSVLVTDFGFADPEIMQVAARACFVIHHESEAELQASFAKGNHVLTPMQYAIEEYKKGNWPAFEAHVFRHDQTGERQVIAKVYTPGKGKLKTPDTADGWIPRGVTVVHLAPHFRRLFGDRAKAN